MAEVKIKPGSLEIEVLDQGKTVALLNFPMLKLDKVTVEPTRPDIRPAGLVWKPEPATAGAGR